MANAKKCDICKALYEPYNQSMDELEYHNTMKLFNKSANGVVYPGGGGITYDLCPICMGKVHELIDSIKEGMSR